MTTIKLIIERALRKIGALAEAEQATADMIEDVKDQLSSLISGWSASSIIIPYLSRTVLLGDNTKASYSWGPGGDIPGVAPTDIAAVSFQLENGLYPLQMADNTTFMGNRTLGIVGMPRWFYYEQQAIPILHFDVAPYGGSFRIAAYQAMDSEFELIDDLELPKFYDRMVINNLAVELCPDYDREPSAVLIKTATESMNTVMAKRLSPVPSQTTDLPGGGHHRSTDLDYGIG